MGPFLRFLLGVFLFLWSLIGLAVLGGSFLIATHIGSAVNQLSSKIDSSVGSISKNFGGGDGQGMMNPDQSSQQGNQNYYGTPMMNQSGQPNAPQPLKK